MKMSSKNKKISNINMGFGFDQFGEKKYREGIYFGCWNNCRYCGVAKTQCEYLTRKDREQWHIMEFNKRKYNVKKDDIGDRKGISIFPTSHDIFPFNKARCFKFIEKIINPLPNVYNELMVFSKPRMSVFKSFHKRFEPYKEIESEKFKKIFLLRFSITSMDDKKLKFWEVNASSFDEREDVLEFCFSKELETSVNIEPNLNSPRELAELIDKVDPYVTETIWVGHMDRIHTEKYLREKGYPQKYIDQHNEIRKNCSEKKLKEIVDLLKNNHKIRYKGTFLRKKNILPLIPKYQIPLI